MIARPQGTLVSQFRYDPVGRLLSQTAGDGSSSVIARKCQCDEVVNLVSIDNRRNGLTCYSYDPIGRIWSAVQPHKTTPTQHIAGTKHSRDPFVSTTKNESVATTKYGSDQVRSVQGPYIEIDRAKIPAENIFDFSATELAAQLKTPFARAAAVADEEVLIYGSISQNGIIRVNKRADE